MSCSNPEVAAGKTKMPRREPVPAGVCMRCRDAKSLYIVRNVTFCRSCFEKNVASRLVRALHPALLPPEISVKSHTPRPKLQTGDAALALSGGAGSTALLEMLYDRAYFAQRLGSDRKNARVPSVWERGYVVHVDFSNVTDVNSQMERLRKMVEERGLTFVGVMAEDAFDPSFRARLRGEHQQQGAAGVSVNLAEPGLPLLSSPSSSTATPLDQLNALLAALPPPSRPALLSNILESLLSGVAETLPNIAHLLVGETSTREAQRVISGTASGRGWSLPIELARSRTLPNKVIRIKAMKELSLKEAAFWCHGRGLETLNERRWDSTVGGTRRDARGKGTIASIEALTERFVASLSVSHPSTVTTINKTGDKLRFTGDSNGPLCPVCELPVDPSATEWKAQASLTSLPGRGQHPVAPPTEGKKLLAPLLCYACLTTLTPLSAAQTDQPTSEAVSLPLWVGERAAQRTPMSREGMRAEISEFLLE